MNRRQIIKSIVSLSVAMLLAIVGAIGWPTRSQAAPQQAPQDSISPAPDDLQLTYRSDRYLQIANSGEMRGETIYFKKCWVCHNIFSKDRGPYLKDLFKHASLFTGEPVTDASVTSMIKNGNPRMMSFGTTLSESDIADLLSYLKSGKCCLDGEGQPSNPSYRAEEQKWPVPDGTMGGAKGTVRVASGDPPEGIKVQLIAPSGVRVTVYTNDSGNYEFPKMQSGAYTLRIATPLEFKPYHRDSVQVADGAKLPDIVLERVATSDALPPTPEIEAQLSGAELLWNLPGSVQEKEIFFKNCGSGCHSYQQILKNRYDERSWRVLVNRMAHHGGGPILMFQPPGLDGGDTTPAEDEVTIKWLARVRSPEAQDPPMHPFPRPSGSVPQAIVTEYPVPHVLLSAHDVGGDSNGNIWFTTHFTRYVGKLDPHTGVVKEYQLPITDGVLPGSLHVEESKKTGMIWFGELYSHNLTRLDPETGKFTQFHVPTPNPVNSPNNGIFAIAPDGYIWTSIIGTRSLSKFDPNTGEMLNRYPFTANPRTYDSLVSPDGKFWAGGSPAGGQGNAAEVFDIATGKITNYNSGGRLSSPRRGGIDPSGNPWYGGTNGTFVELDLKAGRIKEFWPPTPYVPYTDFYECVTDKNGEIWAGELHGRGVLRFNPRTGVWKEYVLPEPTAHDRRAWFDNSNGHMAFWYVDYTTEQIVRLQPLD